MLVSLLQPSRRTLQYHHPVTCTSQKSCTKQVDSIKIFSHMMQRYTNQHAVIFFRPPKILQSTASYTQSKQLLHGIYAPFWLSESQHLHAISGTWVYLLQLKCCQPGKLFSFRPMLSMQTKARMMATGRFSQVC